MSSTFPTLVQIVTVELDLKQASVYLCREFKSRGPNFPFGLAFNIKNVEHHFTYFNNIADRDFHGDFYILGPLRLCNFTEEDSGLKGCKPISIVDENNVITAVLHLTPGTKRLKEGKSSYSG